MLFSLFLWCLAPLLCIYAGRSPKLRAMMAERDFTAQIQLKDGSRARWYRFEGGTLTSASGLADAPQALVIFKDAGLGVRVPVHLCSGMFHFAWPLLRPFHDPLTVVNAAKNFGFEVKGDDDCTLAFTDLMNTMLTHHWKQGTDAGNGETRSVNQTNGGPVFVYVKDGGIVRITPMEFDDTDAPAWKLNARGREFQPPHKATLSPHAFTSRSMIH